MKRRTRQKPKPSTSDDAMSPTAWKSPEGALAEKLSWLIKALNQDHSQLWECVTDPDRVLNPERSAKNRK